MILGNNDILLPEGEMKRILLISVLLALGIFCFAVPLEYKAFKIDGETLYKWVLVTKTKYDSDGNVTYSQSADGTESNYYYSDGLLIRMNTDGKNTYLEYDSKGNNIHAKSEDEEAWLSYDDQNRKTWYKWIYLNYKEEKTTSEYTYTYNDHGDILSDGIYTYKYEYNSKGLKTREIDKASYGTYEYEFEYNNRDQLIKRTYKSSYSSSITEYEYDSAGNLILQKSSDGYEYMYEYNKSNDVIHYRYSVDGIVKNEYWCEYTYYNSGKVKERTSYTHYSN